MMLKPFIKHVLQYLIITLNSQSNIKTCFFVSQVRCIKFQDFLLMYKKVISHSLSAGSLMRVYAQYPLKTENHVSDLQKIHSDNELQFIIPINPKRVLL